VNSPSRNPIFSLRLVSPQSARKSRSFM
jgi:hypothetical protein